ncbi:MAG: class I SAM-dependent methyltransferase family protein [Candidatus Nanohaloarchaea archaeon]
MDLKERLEGKLTEEELEHLVTSYDIVGDVAIVKVPEDLEEEKEVIADAVAEQHPNVRTVLRKTGEREGEYRIADYEFLIGESAETVHKEHGCRFRLDPTEVYFSERLGHERERVVGKAEEDETVIDMFAGVGPFSIEIARNAGVEEVYAFESNPEAFEYLRENVELNKVEETVETFEGDVRDNLPELKVQADRIVMNLPGSSEEFVELALDKVREGGTVHYYSFEPKDELWEDAEEKVLELFEEHAQKVEIQDSVVCGHYNPAVERVCFDVAVKKTGRR